MYADDKNLMYSGALNKTIVSAIAPQAWLKPAINTKLVVAKQDQDFEKELKTEGPANQEKIAELMKAGYRNSILKAQVIEQVGGDLHPDQLESTSIVSLAQKPIIRRERAKKQSIATSRSRQVVAQKKPAARKRTVNKIRQTVCRITKKQPAATQRKRKVNKREQTQEVEDVLY